MPVHPQMVHIPLALSLIVPLLSIGTLVAWSKRWWPRSTWVIPCVLQVLLVLSGFIAMKTGEAEEERVEEVVAHEHIHHHEEAAERFVYASVAVLTLMVAAFFVRREKWALPLAITSIAVALAAFVLAAEAGEHGGELIYRYNGASVYTVDGASHPE